jgi:ribosomal protein S20
MKTEKLSAEKKWQQTQFNEKMGKYGKSKLKNIVKYNLLGLLVFHVTILWSTNFP